MEGIEVKEGVPSLPAVPSDVISAFSSLRSLEMLGIDWTIVLIGIGVLVLLFLLLDFLFAGGGMTGAMMGAAAQCGAATVASPYGWALIVALVILVLGAFGFLFGYR